MNTIDTINALWNGPNRGVLIMSLILCVIIFVVTVWNVIQEFREGGK